MADNVIRRDIIELFFDADTKELTNITKEINAIKKSLGGDFGDEAFENLNDDLKDSSDSFKKANKEAKTFTQSLKDLGNKGAKAAFNGLKKVATISFKALAAGLGAAATAVGFIIKNAVSAYAEFEQLKGGVETLFGAQGAKSVEEYAKLTGKSVSEVKGKYKDLVAAQDIVFKNANNAYKTAGLSANDYMNTVTSFSASLIQSVGGDTKKAAEYADMAISDMSDNANKMGTDMGSIQYAYQGFAKQNYTMLDNLKLGYGGTKTEMERLVKDAAKIDKSIDANSLSYANIVKAIHAVQDQMGITGTTSKEAMFTITGSINSFKAAWGNLMPALIQGGDQFDQCVDNLIESIIGVRNESGKLEGGVINNLKPAITKALSGLGTLITELSPIIEEQFPKLVDELLPPLIKAGTALLKGFIKALPSVIKTVAKEIPDILKELGGAISEAFSDIPVLGAFGDFFKENGDKIAKFIPIVLGLVGAFMAFSKIKSIGSMFGGLFGGGSKEKGGKKGGLFGGLEDLAKMKTTTVLKGMANLAIIFGGMAILTAAFMAVAPHLAKIGDTGAFIKMALIMTALGVVGGVLAKFGEIAGKIQVTTVLKGLANMAIMIAGMSALFLLVGALSLIKLDYGKIIAIVGIIGALGLVGGALTILGGICGLIPVATVALGLANMAIIITGMSALFLLIGAVSLLDFDLGRITKIIGIIGLLGTFGGVLTVFAGICGLIPIPIVLAGLVNMGLVLGGLTALIVAFGKLSEVKGLNEFIDKGGELLVKLFNILGQIGGALIGGLGEGISNSLPAIGENIAKFAQAIKPMFDLFNGVDMGGVGTFFSAIGDFMLKMAGGNILEFFTGKPDFSGVAEGLNTFATSDGVKKFFNMVSGLDEGAFDKGAKLFECLDKVSLLPNVGGIGEMFGGKNDFSGVAGGLGQLASEGVKNFFTMVQDLDESTFEKSKLLFESLASMKDIKIPKDGGFLGMGGESVLPKIAEELSTFAETTGTFFEQVNSLDVGKLDGLWNSLKNAGKLTTVNLGSVIDESIDTIVEKIKGLPKKMGDALKNNSSYLSNGMVEMWKAAVKESVKPVNKLLEGANHILKEFGSKKKVIEWTPYARGTGGHRGGNALVNDGRGAELIQMPNGRMFIPNGKNVLLPNAPRGMKVLNAEQTARLMGKNSPTFKYANGTGDLDVWGYYDNAKGLVDKITENISYEGLSALAANIGQSMVSTFSGEMPAWIEKLFEEGGQSIGSYVSSKGVIQWLPTVIRALKMEGQYSLSNVARTLFQMKTESGGNPMAINNWDSNAKKGTPSKGLMQVIDPTFNAYARSGFNKNIYDPLSNVLASIRYAVSRYGTLAKAYRGVGYADGVGTISIPAQVSSVNLSSVPEGGSTGGRSGVTENNTYAPVMNFYITGTGDERTLMRKVKKAVKEAIDDIIDGAERNNPKLKEV